jgi:hypothetical protein
MDAGRNADAGVSFLDADAQLWLAGRGGKKGQWRLGKRSKTKVVESEHGASKG